MRRGLARLASLLIERILPLVAWSLVVLSLLLERLAESRMGVYRDLLPRNQALESEALAPGRLAIYGWLVLAGSALRLTGFILAVARLASDKRRAREAGPTTGITIPSANLFSRRVTGYLLRTALVGGVLAVMVAAYDNVDWPAFPWMVLSMSIVILAHYVRLAFVVLFPSDTEGPAGSRSAG